MKKTIFIVMAMLILASLACNLTSGGEATVPPQATAFSVGNNGGNNALPSATNQTNFITATSPSTSPTATSFTQSTATQFVQANPVMSGLSFGTSASASPQTVFPSGTTAIYIRWNYSGIPVGTSMRREWYRDGVVVADRYEDWSNNWGTSGRLTHINLYDDDGLTPGNYYVKVSLPSYGVVVDGNFTITAGSPAFSNLTTSMSSNGNSTSVFPYGTEEVFIRFNHSNIPVGTEVVRDWYRNNDLFVTRTEAWKASWGLTGTVNDISIFNRESGYGLEPGDYRVRVYLKNQTTVFVETTFKIEANVGPSFSNLYFSDGPNNAAMTEFPSGTKRVYAIWDYANIPIITEMRRVWKRDGQIFVERNEDWDFDLYSTSGTIKDVFIFDDINGLPDGTYEVDISIVGQSAQVTGSFTIGNAGTE